MPGLAAAGPSPGGPAPAGHCTGPSTGPTTGPSTEPSIGRALLATVLDHARRRPDHPALADDRCALTYADLADEVAATAAALAREGVGPGATMVVALPNCAHFVVSALAGLWLGAAFVPVSADDPAARRAGIVADSGAAHVVSATGDDTTALAVQPLAGGRPAGRARPLRSGGTPPPPVTDPGLDAYLLYTSGTTGTPKGVRVGERALRVAVVCSARAMGLGPATRSLCVSPFHFDGSFGTAFSTLVAGGSLVIPPREELLYLRRFFRALHDDGITHTGFSPSFLHLVLSSPASAGLATSHLRTLGLGGEECVPADLRRLWEIRPSLRVFNRYGPTETTVEVTTSEITPGDLETGRIPVGRPHPGTTFVLHDEGSGIVEGPGVPGQLYIGGEQLMRGYWGDPDLTREVLRTDVVPGTVLYRTGDRMVRDAEGRYVYLGRVDDVVKRKGVRISLRELARALEGVEGVGRAVCQTVPHGAGVRIVAYAEGADPTTPAGVLKALRTRLPPTMLPDEVRVVEALPLSSTGKVGRAPSAPGGPGPGLLPGPP